MPHMTDTIEAYLMNFTKSMSKFQRGDIVIHLRLCPVTN